MVLKTITPVSRSLGLMINKAYNFHHENWNCTEYTWGKTQSFQGDLLNEFGIKLHFAVKDGVGVIGYDLGAIEIHDERKYTMFILRWA